MSRVVSPTGAGCSEHSDQRGELAAGQSGEGPGQTIRDSFTHVAHGADTIGFPVAAVARRRREVALALVPHAGADSAASVKWRGSGDRGGAR